MNKTVIALALLSVCSLANAHFGSVIPNKQIVSDPKDSPPDDYNRLQPSDGTNGHDDGKTKKLFCHRRR